MAAMRERLQRMGGFLAAMVQPNIAAIIAWDSSFALSLHGVADLACGEHTAWQMQRDA